jgi:hypothetical protein
MLVNIAISEILHSVRFGYLEYAFFRLYRAVGPVIQLKILIVPTIDPCLFYKINIIFIDR